MQLHALTFTTFINMMFYGMKQILPLSRRTLFLSRYLIKGIICTRLVLLTIKVTNPFHIVALSTAWLYKGRAPKQLAVFQVRNKIIPEKNNQAQTECKWRKDFLAHRYLVLNLCWYYYSQWFSHLHHLELNYVMISRCFKKMKKAGMGSIFFGVF